MNIDPHNVASDFYDDDSISTYYSSLTELFPPERSILSIVAQKMKMGKVLDIGIGAGRTTQHLVKLCGEYTGLDYSPAMVEESERKFPGVKITQGDVRDLSAFSDSSFDFVFFSYNGLDTLSHADRLRGLKEISRVLTAGGIFIFSSHNKDFKYFDKLPWQQQFEFNIGFAKHCLKTLIHLPRILKAKRHNIYTPEYSVILDEAHFFSLYNYYINPTDQLKQLKELGFENGHCFNKEGKEIAQDKESDFIYYFCNKST